MFDESTYRVYYIYIKYMYHVLSYKVQIEIHSYKHVSNIFHCLIIVIVEFQPTQRIEFVEKIILVNNKFISIPDIVIENLVHFYATSFVIGTVTHVQASDLGLH